MEELEDGVPGSADYPEVDFVLMLGVVILRTSEDHEAAIRLREAATFIGRHALDEFVVLKLVLDGVVMIGARLF
jgi:hypothetical protein